MRRTVAIGITMLSAALAMTSPAARAEDATKVAPTQPWEAKTPPHAAPEDTESLGVRPQQRGIPDAWRSGDPTEGVSPTHPPGQAGSTTTVPR